MGVIAKFRFIFTIYEVKKYPEQLIDALPSNSIENNESDKITVDERKKDFENNENLTILSIQLLHVWTDGNT